ncbi:MAG: hypothetical protein E7297_11225 [Lachnospiraceae bacterium]|jgi:hypothetical protein|nr:hypothetical protein [Lachnospiraceae bacterium]
MTDSNKTKLDISKIGMLLVFAFLFIVTHLIRKQVFYGFTERNWVWELNFVAVVGTGLMLLEQVKRDKNTWKFIALPMIGFVFVIVTQLHFPISWGGILVVFCCNFFPVYLLLLDTEKLELNELIRKLIFVMEIILIVIAIAGVIDKVFDRAHIKLLERIFTCEGPLLNEYATSPNSESKRLYCIYEHPLTTGFMVNMIYAIGIFENKKKRVLLPDYALFALTAILQICCGGKMGIMVFGVMTVMFFFKDWKFWIGAVVLGAIAYFSGIMDNVIYRFTKIQLTTGRATALMVLRDQFPDYRPMLWYGYGEKLGEMRRTTFAGWEWVDNLTSELPFINFSMNYGLLCGIAMLLVPTVLVLIRAIKKKKWLQFFVWLLVFAEVNTYNGFSCTLDIPFIFYFLSMILI